MFGGVSEQLQIKEKRRATSDNSCQNSDGVFSNGVLEVKFNW
jgi:hypothetical protein